MVTHAVALRIAHRSFFPQKFLDCRFHGLGPPLVALLVRVQQVGHDILGQLAVGSEERLVDVQEVDSLVVGQVADQVVDPVVNFPQRVIALGASREDGQQQDFRFRGTLAQLGHNGLDTGSRLGRFILAVAGIVGADHDHGQFRSNAIHLAML